MPRGLLFDAIDDGNNNAIKRLLFDRNFKNGDLAEIYKGQTPAQYAVNKGQWKLVRTIVMLRKTDKDDTYKYGEVLLSAINTYDQPGVCFDLVAGGADLLVNDKDSFRPLQLAAKLNRWKHFEYMFNALSSDWLNNANIKRDLGWALVMALGDHNDIAKKLIAKNAVLTWHAQGSKYTAVHLAIIHNQKDLLELMLKKEVHLELGDKDNKTPIELAAEKGLWDYVELIARSKKTDDKDTYHYGQVLLTAIQQGRPLNEIQALIDAGANLACVNNHQPPQTAAELAASLGRWDYVSAIVTSRKTDEKDTYHYGNVLFTAIEKRRPSSEIAQFVAQGADLTLIKDGKTVMYYCSQNQLWSYVEKIAQNRKTDKEDKARYNSAILNGVYFRISENLLKTILSAGTPAINFRYIGDTHNYALHLAVLNRDTKTIKLLLECGADQTKVNKDELTPIALACANGFWECAEELAKAKPCKFINSKETALAFLRAIRAKKLNVARFLQQSGASITESLDQDSALHLAVLNRDKEAISYLLSINANQTALNRYQETPIELACRLGYWDCAQLFLQSGNNNRDDKKLISDLHLQKALRIAIKKGNVFITNLLLVQGADPNVCNEFGENCFDLARKLDKTIGLQALKNYCREKAKVKSGQRKVAETIFLSLIENAVKPQAIPETILKLEEALTEMLRYDLEKLLDKRDEVKKQDVLISVELDKVDKMISVINSLLNFPLREVNFFDQDSDIAKDICYYLLRKFDINYYAAAVKNYLTQLDYEISNTKWKVGSLFHKEWLPGLPTHVKLIQDKLQNLQYLTTNQEILQLYADISKILTDMSPNTYRHPETTRFYIQKCMEMSYFAFATGDPAYARFNVHVPVQLEVPQTAPEIIPLIPAAIAEVQVDMAPVFQAEIPSAPLETISYPKINTGEETFTQLVAKTSKIDFQILPLSPVRIPELQEKLEVAATPEIKIPSEMPCPSLLTEKPEPPVATKTADTPAPTTKEQPIEKPKIATELPKAIAAKQRAKDDIDIALDSLPSVPKTLRARSSSIGIFKRTPLTKSEPEKKERVAVPS